MATVEGVCWKPGFAGGVAKACNSLVRHAT